MHACEPHLVRFRRSRALAVAALGLIVLLAAGCGSTKKHPPRHKQLSPAASALATFAANDCGQCHTFAPAKATGTIGPNLNKLKEAARADRLPLSQFVYQAITDPNTYVAPGYQAGVMPADYLSGISGGKLAQLVTYLATHTH